MDHSVVIHFLKRSLGVFLLLSVTPCFGQDWKKSYTLAHENWGVSWDNTIKYLEEAEQQAKVDRGIFDHDYLVILNDLGIAYYESGNFSKARTVLETSEAFRSEILEPTDKERIISQLNLAQLYRYTDTEKAIIIYERILKTAGGSSSIKALQNLYDIYIELGEHDRALTLLSNSASLNNSQEFDFMILLLQADAQRREGNFQETLDLLNFVSVRMDSISNHLLQKSVESAYFEQLGMLYMERQDFTEAEASFKKVLELKEYLGLPKEETVNTLNNIANLYEKFGLYGQSLSYIDLALQNCTHHCERLLQNKAALFLKTGQVLESEIILNDLFNDYSFKSPNEELVFLLNYANTFRNSQAIGSNPALDKAAELVERNGEVFSDMDLANFYAAKGAWAIYEGNIDEAIRSLEISKQKYVTVYGSAAPQLRQIENNLGVCYILSGRFEEGSENLFAASNKEEQLIRFIFPMLSRSEQTVFLSEMRKDLDVIYSAIAPLAGERTDLAHIMINKQLLYKGLTLESKRGLKEIQKLDQNDKTAGLLEEFLAIRQELTSSFTRGGFDGEIQQSMIRRLNELESEIARHTGRQLSATADYNSIRSALDDDEAVVEIIRYKNQNFSRLNGETDSINYVGLVIKPSFEDGPQVVELGSGDYLENRQLKFYLNAIKYEVADTTSYTYFWKPFESLLEGIKTAYLVDDGLYFKINPESLMNPENSSFLGSTMRIRHLHNAGEIVKVKAGQGVFNGSHQALLVGDPVLSESQGDSRFASLPGTREEIIQISGALQKEGWGVTSLTGTEATKARLYSQEPSALMHFATHGFFSRREVKQRQDLPDLELFRSGLVLTATDSRQGDLLTAFEVSDMDLSATELVVLSACETGLGELKNGDGVYGLQYAFFVAGAESMIISLWQVSDKVTKEYMSSFYAKLLASGNKRIAYEYAVDEMKKKYQAPKYWAPFIYLGN
ncbi:CHAT domain-containing protein [Fulvivirga sedimenti]|uniref:CHAT domain-containing protein n=1 Tax=Fulvivirga sedimenti TaxID=2879465 RepID=A0A9X1HSS3_9BACT|nr:CHAT domain-containing protein [Fulvivirga sedimenti]MCA6074791.1 CHAT domain-containing protein [Fulvivirga sedimenti]MCA6075968.1 CHAT domain-containing protein [Fulvivirga sedimenti]MCA6077096.1 CHAT domain-containing protein [Fulvivirga sedimenti]